MSHAGHSSFINRRIAPGGCRRRFTSGEEALDKFPATSTLLVTGLSNMTAGAAQNVTVTVPDSL